MLTCSVLAVRVERGRSQLKGVAGLGVPIIEYLLPEVLAKIKARSVGPN
jgi:hypothetical protein